MVVLAVVPLKVLLAAAWRMFVRSKPSEAAWPYHFVPIQTKRCRMCLVLLFALHVEEPWPAELVVVANHWYWVQNLRNGSCPHA